ncbi:MAG: hypothetical protein ACE5F1_09020, partial [Planctomycetota bacterium]
VLHLRTHARRYRLETAQLEGCSPAAARIRIHRARRPLQKELESSRSPRATGASFVASHARAIDRAGVFGTVDLGRIRGPV